MAKFCVNCGTPLPDEAGFCPKCGTKVEIPHCPSCGKEVDFETEYCIYCGARLKEEPIPESEPVMEPIQSKEIPVATPEEDAGPKENNGSTFSWTYRRSYRRKHSFAAKVDNDYLLIAESERNSDGDYTIDLSENEGLGMLGGWFTYALYNVEDQFCGMSGENGVTSFSVSYGYSTDYPTSTWLELVLLNSEGVETRDYVSLY